MTGPARFGDRGGDRPNVILFVMDTTRAAETVPVDPDVTPTLASLAERGTAYSRAFSAAPWTLPSHASLFTGTYPRTHGAHGEHTYLDDALPTLAELFGGAGYDTAGVSNNVWIASEFGFTRGFDVFDESPEDPGDESDLDALVNLVADPFSSRLPGESALDALARSLAERVGSSTDNGAARAVEWVERWLDARSGADPFFLFVNCIEPHLDYRPPREHAAAFLPSGWSYEEAMALPQDPREYDVDRFELSSEEWAVLRSLYRAEIAYLDEKLRALVDALQAAGEWEDTVLLVTGDHGENIGEHDLLGHQYSLHDTLLHVPLVVTGGRFDGGLPGSDDLVQLVDVPPTLLDAAGVDAPEGFEGRSFHPSADSASRSNVFAEYYAPRPPVEVLEETYGDVPERIYTFQRSLRAVRTDRFKYIRGSDGSRTLYDVVADPGETTDVAAEHPDRVADLDATLDEWASGADETTPDESVSVSESTEQRLSELGYL